MIHRSPQRSYTSQTIELWFNRLNHDWECYFSDEELRWGRHYYRTGEVRSTELLEGSAIVHFKRGKEPLYIIVDWEKDRPNFRESHPEIAPGHGLAAAGMYELEEFIADEVPAIHEERNGGAANERLPVREKLVEKPTDRNGRKLRIRLAGKADGLWLEAGWQKGSGKTDWSHFSLRELNLWEREQLIGYTARAHRTGFRPGDREGTYRLQDEGLIARFFKDDLKRWRQQYPVIEDAGVKSWRRGVQLVRPLIEVTAAGANGRFRIDFSSRGSVVPDGIRQHLFRSPGHTHFAPGEGIFQVDPKVMGSVHEWKSLLGASGEGSFPRYLLFSIARDPNVQLNLSTELAEWRRQLEEATEAADALELPDYLREYQKNGIAWLRKLELAGCPGLLADEMGLGKTLQVLNYLSAVEALGKENILVVCPASVVPVWRAELDRFFPGTPVKVLSRNQPFTDKEPALWISSYTQLRRNKQLLDSMQFDYAVLDEAQSIKNPDAKVTHACMAIQSRHRLALTGTPMENRPLDLWTIFRFLMPGFLGTRRFFEDNLKSDDQFLEKLRLQIAPFILRRTKGAVAEDLPPKVEIDWICPLSPVQRRCYEQLTSGASGQFKGSLKEMLREKRIHLFSLLTRLRQACCDPGLLPDEDSIPEHSGKLQSLNNRLGEAFEGGSKVVVFSQFVKFLNRAKSSVKEAFPEIPQVELTGSTLDRERPVERFKEIDGAAVFFISLKAGGTGLNLQVADYVFLLDPWWNPAVEAQAIDRVHRIGQQQRVIVYRMITKGTIEERIEGLKKEKGRIFDDLLSDMDAPGDIFNQFDSLEELIELDSEDF